MSRIKEIRDKINELNLLIDALEQKRTPTLVRKAREMRGWVGSTGDCH